MSIDSIIESLERKAQFLIQHRDLLAQLEHETVYSNRRSGSQWGSLTYADVSADYGDDIDIHVYGPDAKQVMAIIRKAIAPGQWDKSANYDFELTREIDGLQVTIKASRDAVCQRVVTGTKTVVRPPVEAQPERVEEVEEVEWVCGTLAG